MGEQGYAKLKTDMAWSTIAKSLLAVYSELAQARGSGKPAAGEAFAGTGLTTDKEQ
jgi:hypothetical protein